MYKVLFSSLKFPAEDPVIYNIYLPKKKIKKKSTNSSFS